MMFPAIAAIDIKEIVEEHPAQPEHNEFPDIPNVNRCVKPIDFEALPTQAFLIAERRHLIAKDVAQKPQLETLMKDIRSDDDSIVVLNQQNLAAPGMRIELKQRKKDSSYCNGAKEQENQMARIGSRGEIQDDTDERRCGKNERQNKDDANPADLVPL